MDRRDSIKSLLAGSLAGGLALTGCDPVSEQNVENVTEPADYGRTPEEKARDARINSEQYFNDHELNTIAILCDLILPTSGTNGSAVDAGVPEFIDFIVKDMPYHQVPIRGGLMWLDHRATQSFNLEFASCSDAQQKTLLDEIAYPQQAKPEVKQGVLFFSWMRRLVLTGYYTTRIGIDDLGYKGNTPNVWDGVPEDVLNEHDVAYDKEWIAKCVDQEKRFDLAEWDDDGNLIT